ncbi:MAG: hypothetical protein COA44_11780 [Arcobacter sp.]|nr:MAG: hypothetical protein COA44_11780 [Arcobacter sp.]
MPSKSQTYLDLIFCDKIKFEEEVLRVKCDEDRKEVMSLICSEICSDKKLAKHINFLKIKTVNDLDFDGVNIAFVQLLLAELLSLLKEKNLTFVEIENVKKNKQYLKFMYELSQIYMRRFSGIFYKEVVNTFFDLLSIADKPEKLSPVVKEVINGTAKRKSLLEQHGSGQILYKEEQAWMRVKQARDDKKHQAQVFQVEIVRLVRRVDQLKLQISAIVAARALSLVDVKKVTSKLLLDMFTDEDDIQLHTKKTMFSYVPAGDMANTLISTAQKAAEESKDPSNKNDYIQIADFFKKCKSMNTPVFIDARFEEYKHELSLKSKAYREQRLKLKTLRAKPLDSFDITLKKVKEAMVYNLQHL